MSTKKTEAWLVPANECAERLGRHPVTLRKDLRDGNVPGVRIGGRWFMSSEVLDDITGRPVTAGC